MTYRYRTLKVAGKTKLLHRHLVEQKLGRKLTADEHVHHKDENKLNNADGNLEPKPAAEHRKLHADERLVYPREKACIVCGANFTPAPSKRKRQKTCSKVCADAARSATEKVTKADQRTAP